MSFPAQRVAVARVVCATMRIDQITAELAVAGLAVLAGGFAALTSRNPEPCEICGGAGNWGCVICDGEGFLVEGRASKKCVACVGRGKRLCRKCAGSGWKKRTNYIVRLRSCALDGASHATRQRLIGCFALLPAPPLSPCRAPQG
jgi:DnaJ-class molecular chaperone